MSEAVERRGWLDIAEKGSVLGIQFFVQVCTFFGRAPAHLVLRVVALYYVLAYPSVRRASRAYWRRLGADDSFSQLYRHVLRFGEVAIDRFFIVTGRTRHFRVVCRGQEHIEELHRTRRGAILLGAHLGSFEAMRMAGREQSIATLNIVGNFGNARMINRALEKVAPGIDTRVINLDHSALGAVLEVRARVQAGEMVAVLGDRVAGDERFTEVDFLGKKARFPTGAFLLASILKCPVYLTFGLYRAPDGYDIYCEPFTELVELPRKDRDAALHDYVQRFAARLEHYVRLAPDNWFNFYDFWRET